MSMIIFLISSTAGLLAVSYYALIRWLVYQWRKLPVWQPPETSAPELKVSILVPARNEAAHIGRCLDRLLAQQYPPELMEIIVIDDHSVDDTAAIVSAFPAPNVKLLSLAELLDHPTFAYKKMAITKAVEQASGELILTIDADCEVGPEWLFYMTTYFQARPCQCLVGPVAFHQEANWLERFQSLDFAGMMVTTGAGVASGKLLMGNGANLAYPKAVFEAVGGYEGVSAQASGDDLFLIHKIAGRYPGGVQFVRQAAATVLTRAKPNLHAFVQQRIRWGTKNASYKDKRVTLVAALVFAVCWTILLAGIASLIVPATAFPIFLFLLIIKTIADQQLLWEATDFFQRKDLRKHFLLAQFAHILYIAWIGAASMIIREYEWKGRRVQ